jgi:hypothetical protein
MAAAPWAGPWDCPACPVPGLEEERHLLLLRDGRNHDERGN